MSKDVQVTVHIIEGRELKGRSKSGTSDPMCQVQIGSNAQKTDAHKKTSNCVWDHMMFYHMRLTEKDFNAQTMSVSVFDTGGIFRNELIGRYEFDLKSVYGQKGHEMWRQWVGLFDPDHGSGVQGYLKLSVSIMKPGDTPVAHGDDDDDDDAEGADLQSLVLMPPGLDLTGYHLFVRIYKAKDLPRMDTFGKCDGYMQCKFAGNPPVKTKTIKNSFAPMWNEELRIPVYTPNMSDRIEIQLLDWDREGSDELIATALFQFTDIVQEPWGPSWVNFYGAPDTGGAGAMLKSMMASGKMEQTMYKGSALIALEAEVSDHPKLGKRNLPRVQDPITQEYTLRFDLFEGSEFPVGFLETVYVEVSVGKTRIESRAVDAKGGYAKWYQALEEMVEVWPVDLEQVPDIMVSVFIKPKVGSKARVGYLRFRAAEYHGLNNAVEWHTLKPDKMSPAIEGDESVAGFVQFRLSFGPTRDVSRSPRPPVSEPTTKPYELRAHIYQARNLPGADATGLADPYCMVRLGGKSDKTKRCNGTLFPQWYQTVRLQVQLPHPLARAPDIQVHVYDWNQVSSDDYLGRFSVPLSGRGDGGRAPKVGKEMPRKPQWFPLTFDGTGGDSGAVLAAFQLVPAGEADGVSIPKLKPKFRPCIFEIAAVGVRNMLPYMFMEIQNPYIEFDMGERTDESMMRTVPSNTPSGPNANHLQVIALPVDLPEDPLYAPYVNVRVYDKRFAGISAPLVGSASIPVSPYMPWSSETVSRHNLPPIVRPGEIPGAQRAEADAAAASRGDGDEDGEAADTSDVIPINIDECNQETGELFEFVTPKKGALGKRTIPEPDEQMVGGMAEESEDEDADVEKNRPIPHELEHTLKDLPFDEFPLVRGKTRGVGFFDRLGSSSRDESSTIRTVGVFKGNFRVIEKGRERNVPPPPDLEQMFLPKSLMVRAYVVKGMALVAKDRNGYSDPYIKIRNGKAKANEVDDVDHHLEKTNNPEFFKCYELPTELPGDSTLEIDVWDWDKIGGDELIGSTSVDLENRWFCQEWKQLAPKPREIRTLWAPTTDAPQGQIEMWLEIMTDDEARRVPPTALAPPAPEPYELRVIVWKTRGVAANDSGLFSSEATTSDIYVSCTVEEYGKQDTDVHWKSADGTGEFNWRMVWSVRLPTKVPRLKVQLWDKEMIGPNDAIAEANINLKGFFKKALKAKRMQEIDSQWIALTHPNFEGTKGEVQMSIQILTEKEAADRPCGLGRGAPNQHPTLAEPDRPRAYKPWELHKMVQDQMRRNKKYLYAAGAILILIVFGPVLLPLLLR